MEDAIRELVRAIKGNVEANEALDRLASCDDFDAADLSDEMVERIYIERAAVR